MSNFTGDIELRPLQFRQCTSSQQASIQANPRVFGSGGPAAGCTPLFSPFVLHCGPTLRAFPVTEDMGDYLL
jgi:hypothetical protein